MLITLLYFCLIAIGDNLTERTVHPIVVDAETMARISDVTVTVDGNARQQTKWDGSFTVPDTFAVITLAKRGYLQRTIYRNELTDTIKLINNGKCLDEVVVVGHYPKMQFSFQSSVTGGGHSQGGGGFDMNQLLDNIINYKRHKRLRKTKKVLSGY